MTNPEWIPGAPRILLTLLGSCCPWKQWGRISDKSRQDLHSEPKDLWGVGFLSAGALFSSLAGLHEELWVVVACFIEQGVGPGESLVGAGIGAGTCQGGGPAASYRACTCHVPQNPTV